MAHEWDHARIKKAIDDRELEIGDDITYGEIADYCGVTWGTIERVVNGRANPSVSLMSRIAKFLDKPLSYFHLGDGDQEDSANPNGGKSALQLAAAIPE